MRKGQSRRRAGSRGASHRGGVRVAVNENESGGVFVVRGVRERKGRAMRDRGQLRGEQGGAGREVSGGAVKGAGPHRWPTHPPRR